MFNYCGLIDYNVDGVQASKRFGNFLSGLGYLLAVELGLVAGVGFTLTVLGSCFNLRYRLGCVSCHRDGRYVKIHHSVHCVNTTLH